MHPDPAGMEPRDGDFVTYVERLVAREGQRTPERDDQAVSAGGGHDTLSGVSRSAAAPDLQHPFGRSTEPPQPVEHPATIETGTIVPTPWRPGGVRLIVARIVDALAMLAIIIGAGLIAAAILPDPPWMQTPLPGVLTLIAAAFTRQRFGSSRFG